MVYRDTQVKYCKNQTERESWDNSSPVIYYIAKIMSLRYRFMPEHFEKQKVLQHFKNEIGINISS